MKKQIFLSFTLLLLIIGCKKEETPQPETEVTVPTETVQQERVERDCYAFEADDNKIELLLERNGDEATGTLNYLLSEKDSNTGTFKGKIENNILLADYTFQSEGMESTRQVAFKFINNQWVEGYGEMNEEGIKFKDISKLDFNSSMPLSKTNCPK